MKPRQNETEYQEIKKVLKGSDVTSEEQLNEKINGMLKAARLYSLIGGLLMIIFLVLLPRFSIFTIMIFCLFMAWLWSSTIASKNYFQRYLDESKSEVNNNDEVQITATTNSDKDK